MEIDKIERVQLGEIRAEFLTDIYHAGAQFEPTGKTLSITFLTALLATFPTKRRLVSSDKLGL
jgi:hypothetical protein